MKFGKTLNRGFYYGNSQDSPWNQDLSWKACCEREQLQVSKFVFPDGIEGAIPGGSAAAEGQSGENDKKRKESTRREEGGSEIGSQIGSNISARSGKTHLLLNKLAEERKRLLDTQKDLLTMLTEERQARHRSEAKLVIVQRKVDDLARRLTTADDSHPWRSGMKSGYGTAKRPGTSMH